MPVPPRFAIYSLSYNNTPAALIITCTTDIACHLWIHYTTLPPITKEVWAYRRGIAIYLKRKWWLKACTSNEQDEPGDTLTHTFTKPTWPICVDTWFVFTGKVGGIASPSQSALYTYHRLWPLFTTYFYPDRHPEVTSVDGFVDLDTWALGFHTLRDGAGDSHIDHSANLHIQIQCANAASPNYWNYLRRSIFLFDTSGIPAGATIISAKVRLYLSVKMTSNPWHPSVAIYESFPASNDDLVNADYQALGSTPLSNIIPESDLVEGFITFTLNEAGLQNVIPAGITKLGLREASYDGPGIDPGWSPEAYYLYTFLAADEPTLALGPRLEVTYQPQC